MRQGSVGSRLLHIHILQPKIIHLYKNTTKIHRCSYSISRDQDHEDFYNTIIAQIAEFCNTQATWVTEPRRPSITQYRQKSGPVAEVR